MFEAVVVYCYLSHAMICNEVRAQRPLSEAQCQNTIKGTLEAVDDVLNKHKDVPFYRFAYCAPFERTL